MFLVCGIRDRAGREEGAIGTQRVQPAWRRDKGDGSMGSGSYGRGHRVDGAAAGRGTERSRGVLQGCTEFEGFLVMVQARFLGEVGVQVEVGGAGMAVLGNGSTHRPCVLRPYLHLSPGQV